MEINVVFLGGPWPGKTQLIKFSCSYIFNERSSPTDGFYFVKKLIEINNIKYTLLLWDTSGREKFREMNKLLFKYSNFFILVYDITYQSTFKNIHYWYNEIKASGKDAIIGVVGTHLDLYTERKVDTEIAKKFADSIGAKFIEVSAKEDIEPFNIMLKELTNNYNKKYGSKDKEKKDNNIVPKKYLREFTKNTLLKYYKY